MNRLKQLGNIPVTNSILENIYLDCRYPRNKIAGLEKKGSLIRLKRGMYVVSPEISGKLLSGELLANHIYGPSYVSMESALRFHGLIPESVNVVKSMTVKRARDFKNSVGLFEYISCDEVYFSIGIDLKLSNETTFLIASPEKALCDFIAYTPNLRPRFIKSLHVFLEEDLRFDMSALNKMDPEIVRSCSETGKKKNELKNLLKLLLKPT